MEAQAVGGTYIGALEQKNQARRKQKKGGTFGKAQSVEENVITLLGFQKNNLTQKTGALTRLQIKDRDLENCSDKCVPDQNARGF